jgi:hypothetical protein
MHDSQRPDAAVRRRNISLLDMLICAWPLPPGRSGDLCIA